MSVSANQQFKTYKGKLEAAAQAGGPLGEHSRAKLALLSELDRTARFKWFCANVLGEDINAPRRDKREDAAVAMAEAVGHNGEVDNDAAMQVLELLAAQLGVQLISPEIKVVAEKPTKTRKARKATSKKAGNTGMNRWRLSTLAKLGYKSGKGQQFKHKGTRWIIVDTDGEFAYSVKA